MKLKPKHWKITNHYARFIDNNWFPNFQITKEVVEAFIKYESNGLSAISEEERELISPLVGEVEKSGSVAHTMTGKPSYELLKKQLHEEIFDWWGKGWGWSPPISSNIEYEFKNRHEIKNDIYLRELIWIKRKLSVDIIDYLLSLDGSIFNREEINRILDKKIANNNQILKELKYVAI